MGGSATATLALPSIEGVTFRLYRGLDDVPGMAAANSRYRERFGVLEAVDVDSMRNHYAHLENCDPTTDCLIVEIDGQVAGYARCEWHDLYDGDRTFDTTALVEPAAWGRGITLVLLEWSERRLREIAASLPAVGRSWCSTEVFGTDEEPMHAARELGYEVARPWAEMLRPTLDDPLPDERLPDGYRFRTFGADDRRAVWEMLDRSFVEHWGEWRQGDEAYEEWVNDPRQDVRLYVGATDGVDIASVVLNVLERLPDGALRGELSAIATLPAHRRRGLARACIARSLRLLREEGATSAWLGVDMLNENQALTLYESCGFRVATRGYSLRRPFTNPLESR